MKKKQNGTNLNFSVDLAILFKNGPDPPGGGRTGFCRDLFFGQQLVAAGDPVLFAGICQCGTEYPG